MSKKHKKAKRKTKTKQLRVKQSQMESKAVIASSPKYYLGTDFCSICNGVC